MKLAIRGGRYGSRCWPRGGAWLLAEGGEALVEVAAEVRVVARVIMVRRRARRDGKQW